MSNRNNNKPDADFLDKAVDSVYNLAEPVGNVLQKAVSSSMSSDVRLFEPREDYSDCCINKMLATFDRWLMKD